MGSKSVNGRPQSEGNYSMDSRTSLLTLGTKPWTARGGGGEGFERTPAPPLTIRKRIHAPKKYIAVYIARAYAAHMLYDNVYPRLSRIPVRDSLRMSPASACAMRCV